VGPRDTASRPSTGRRGRPTRVLIVVAGIVLATALSTSLLGCVVDDATLGRVFDAVRGKTYNLDAESERQLARFHAAYEKYVLAGDGNRQLNHFADAFTRVRADYVREVGDAVLIDAAIKGAEDLKAKPRSVAPGKLVEAALDSMLASLDPHSAYLTPSELRDIHISTKGEFGGLGIEITIEDKLVKVVSPIEDTPAYRAGIKSGDLITHLDGDPVAGMSLSRAVHRMRGRPGTDIRLTVSRAGVRPFQVTITRAVIRIKAVRWRVEGDIGYLRVAAFNERVKKGVTAAMKGIEARLGPRLRGIVLDLRNNPGGLLDQSVALADGFLDSGIVVAVRGRGPRNERVYRAVTGDLAHDLPIVVLVNGGSASASEIVAVALQDNGRATVMGSRSFGKGTVQTITPLPLEGALRLTTALYYSPSGRAIQAQGVSPDIVIIPEDKGKRQRESDLAGSLPARSTAAERTRASVSESRCPAAGEKKDRELGCALAMLRAGSPEKFLASAAARRPSM
jgi:carboxyl-terminal processing protease